MFGPQGTQQSPQEVQVSLTSHRRSSPRVRKSESFYQSQLQKRILASKVERDLISPHHLCQTLWSLQMETHAIRYSPSMRNFSELPGSSHRRS